MGWQRLRITFRAILVPVCTAQRRNYSECGQSSDRGPGRTRYRPASTAILMTRPISLIHPMVIPMARYHPALVTPARAMRFLQRYVDCFAGRRQPTAILIVLPE